MCSTKDGATKQLKEKSEKNHKPNSKTCPTITTTERYAVIFIANSISLLCTTHNITLQLKAAAD
jgi:hypothetical protein